MEVGRIPRRTKPLTYSSDTLHYYDPWHKADSTRSLEVTSIYTTKADDENEKENLISETKSGCQYQSWSRSNQLLHKSDLLEKLSSDLLGVKDLETSSFDPISPSSSVAQVDVPGVTQWIRNTFYHIPHSSVESVSKEQKSTFMYSDRQDEVSEWASLQWNQSDDQICSRMLSVNGPAHGSGIQKDYSPRVQGGKEPDIPLKNQLFLPTNSTPATVTLETFDSSPYTKVATDGILEFFLQDLHARELAGDDSANGDSNVDASNAPHVLKAQDVLYNYCQKVMRSKATDEETVHVSPKKLQSASRVGLNPVAPANDTDGTLPTPPQCETTAKAAQCQRSPVPAQRKQQIMPHLVQQRQRGEELLQIPPPPPPLPCLTPLPARQNVCYRSRTEETPDTIDTGTPTPISLPRRWQSPPNQYPRVQIKEPIISTPKHLLSDEANETLIFQRPDVQIHRRNREVLGPNLDENAGRGKSSAGSMMHPVNCKACAFYWTKGCVNGSNCQFCHEWHSPKKKKPMKDQKNLMIIARPDGKIEFLRCTVQEALRRS